MVVWECWEGASGPWTVLSELVLTNCSFGCGGDCGGGIKDASGPLRYGHNQPDKDNLMVWCL